MERAPRPSVPAILAALAVLALLFPPPSEAQAASAAGLKELFEAYEYYEDAPGTRAGIPTPVALDPSQLDSIRLTMRDRATAGFAMLARKDENHWMGLERNRALQLLRIRDAANEYNARVVVDMTNGRLTVLRGVDYKPFNDAEDAAITAFLAVGYLRRAMAGGEVFPASLRVPAVDLASLGISPSPAGTAAPASGAPTSASPAASPASPGLDARGSLRLWSTAGVAARELFAADKFGNDSALESGDFAQAVLAYSDAEGPAELTGKDLEVRILGRARAPENPLRVEELEAMLASLASKVGGVDVSIGPLSTTFHVPSTPPTPPAGSGPAGSRDPVVRTFEYLQALSLLSGDYTVVPEAAMIAPGFTQQDLEIYWWARLQRASTPSAFYPPLVDSGGRLPWGEFALFATAGLRREGVPCVIALIRRPGKARVPYHAVCFYQVGGSWRWMDSGRLGDESASSWADLPARIYGKDVVYRVVDVAREWLRSTVDESSGWVVSRLQP
jgi:hypothetical protein